MKLTGEGGKQISPILILIVIIALVIFVLLAQRKVTNKAKDRSTELSASLQCKVCGQDNPHEARFCGNCGATLPVSAEVPEPAVAPSQAETAPAIAAEYAGFWIRFVAALIDVMVVWLLSFVLSFLLQSWYVSWLPGLMYYWLFIGLKGQTPGKMVVRIKVVNDQGDRPGLGGAALREILGKIISTIALFVGFLWIAFDDDKQGWHDKIASTYVVKI